MYMQLEQEETL